METIDSIRPFSVGQPLGYPTVKEQPSSHCTLWKIGKALRAESYNVRYRKA